MNSKNTERILLVESDPDIRDLIARQVLEPLGYQVQLASDVNTAIQYTSSSLPDLVIADLNLPGLSGKDLLVALHSQGIQVPVIVIAEKGQEKNIIQAFRLGGTDYLLWPVRETEVISAVERALEPLRENSLHQRVNNQLKETSQELHRREIELNSLYDLGKAMSSITDQRLLFDKIMEGMVKVAQADYSWLLVRDELVRKFVMSSQYNLPVAWANKLGQPLDDGVSSLVALSGETLSINGDPLKRFKIASLGNSVMVAPIKVQKEVIGLLIIVRKANIVFDHNTQSLLEAVADYASVSLINARLFRALQNRGSSNQVEEKARSEKLLGILLELQVLLRSPTSQLELLLSGRIGKLNYEQQHTLKSIQKLLQHAVEMVTM